MISTVVRTVPRSNICNIAGNVQEKDQSSPSVVFVSFDQDSGRGRTNCDGQAKAPFQDLVHGSGNKDDNSDWPPDGVQLDGLEPVHTNQPPVLRDPGARPKQAGGDPIFRISRPHLAMETTQPVRPHVRVPVFCPL